MIRFIAPLIIFGLLVTTACPQEKTTPDSVREYPGEFPYRKAPTMTIEQAIALARKAVARQGTKIDKFFLARAEYEPDAGKAPVEAREFADGPFWRISYLDPKCNLQGQYPAPFGVQALVFSETRVAIFAQ